MTFYAQLFLVLPSPFSPLSFKESTLIGAHVD